MEPDSPDNAWFMSATMQYSLTLRDIRMIMHKLKAILFFPAGMLFAMAIVGQTVNPPAGEVFVDSIVPRIDISIHPDTLQWIYDHPDSNEEFHADFVFDNGNIRDTVDNIGFRLRGNTSRYALKKSFKVSFNTFEPGREFYGLEKMNLNGEHNDPSVIRSKLCWELFRDFGLPAARANHVELFINGSYYGLYMNTEHIDEEFVESRFGNQNGNLYKCLWPADLDYLGSNPDLYKFTNNGRRAYDLKTNTAQDDYSDLAGFIGILNNVPSSQLLCEIETVLNVFDYMKIAAIDVMTGDWDGYIYNKNNFYLYHNTATGQFEYIPYDLDNTLGIDWIGRDWGNRNIYDWQQHGNESRPLYTRLIALQTLRDQYSWYIDRVIDSCFANPGFLQKIHAIREMITPYVAADPYYPLDYGFTIQDFHNSYQQALGGHVAYGLQEYLQTRSSSATAQLELNNTTPVIKYIRHSHPAVGEDLWITAWSRDDDENITVAMRYSVNGGTWQEKQMSDDGLHHDQDPGDDIYGAAIENIQNNTHILFQVKSEDAFGNGMQLPCDPVELEIYNSTLQGLYINEFMASNASVIADEYGEYEDWIEIYNNSGSEVWLGSRYMSDDLEEPSKGKLPDVFIPDGGFVLLWADGDPDQGEYHMPFRLDKDGEEIGLFDEAGAAFALLDSVTYDVHLTDVSQGRLPDGGDDWSWFSAPTPGSTNTPNAVPETGHNNPGFYPNPVEGGYIYFKEPTSCRLYDVTGMLLLQAENAYKLEVASISPGIYLLKIGNGGARKIVIL